MATFNGPQFTASSNTDTPVGYWPELCTRAAHAEAEFEDDGAPPMVGAKSAALPHRPHGTRAAGVSGLSQERPGDIYRKQLPFFALTSVQPTAMWGLR